MLLKHVSIARVLSVGYEVGFSIDLFPVLVLIITYMTSIRSPWLACDLYKRTRDVPGNVDLFVLICLKC